MDEHWKAAAADLGRLFAVMRGVDPRNLGPEPQRTLAAYEPPPGLWSDDDRARRDRLVAMDRRVFDSVYATWLRGV